MLSFRCAGSVDATILSMWLVNYGDDGGYESAFVLFGSQLARFVNLDLCSIGVFRQDSLVYLAHCLLYVESIWGD